MVPCGQFTFRKRDQALGQFANFLYHLLLDGEDAWRPLLAVHYLTYACAFRCPYCSDGAQNPYHTLREKPLDSANNLALLKRIRSHCDHLVLTGGEPLQHPEIGTILDGLPALDFRSITFTTNGHGLEAHLPRLARCATELVVSLDTLDEAKSDACFGAGPGTFRRILAGLEMARSIPARRYEILISAVITPENLDDLPELYRWTQGQGFRLAACPQLMGKKAHPELAADPRYRAFFDLLIAEKRRGGDIHGTIPYLEHMRDLAAFRCRPFALLVTSPQGNVFYPCLEMGTYAGNLLQESNLRTLRRKGRDAHGPKPICGDQCHSACSLGFATMFERPSSLVQEAWLQLRYRSGRGRIIRE
jgi:MoaA/NifB/PqqE/SkfB family radical SAM enzyme